MSETCLRCGGPQTSPALGAVCVDCQQKAVKAARYAEGLADMVKLGNKPMTPTRAALVAEARKPERQCSVYGPITCRYLHSGNPNAWCNRCLLAALVETEPVETTDAPTLQETDR